MKQIIKAVVKTTGTMEIEVPNNFNDNEIMNYILEHLEKVEWDEIEEKDVDYILVENNILEEDDNYTKEPEDNTYSGGIYE